jgi:hypothetical protein
MHVWNILWSFIHMEFSDNKEVVVAANYIEYNTTNNT